MTEKTQLRLLRKAARMIDEVLRNQEIYGNDVECPACRCYRPLDESHQPSCPLKLYRYRNKKGTKR